MENKDLEGKVNFIISQMQLIAELQNKRRDLISSAEKGLNAVGWGKLTEDQKEEIRERAYIGDVVLDHYSNGQVTMWLPSSDIC